MTEPRTLPALPGLEKTSFEFRSGILSIAEKTGFPADEIAAVMYSESKFAPDAYNPNGGASGLIQFMPFVAKLYGTSGLAIRLMSREEQLELVERFYKGQKKPVLPGDTYVSTFLPAAVGKPDDFVLARKDSADASLVPGVTLGKMYESNRGLDTDKNGEITTGDVRRKILGYLETAKKKPRLPADGDDGSWHTIQTRVLPRAKRLAPALGVASLVAGGVYWLSRRW